MLGVGAAGFDAGIAAWTIKRFYDTGRPLQMLQCEYANQQVSTVSQRYINHPVAETNQKN